MILVGLTGGMGAGKSSVSTLLAERGAVIIDADAITRELQEPGTPVFEAIVARFGETVVTEDGRLDRQALADVVFADPDDLQDLNDIVHPAVGVELMDRLRREADTDHVVILDVPLLVESGRDDMAGLVVVDVDPDIAVGRLVEQRGVPEADARARMAQQASRQERLDKADFVIDNSGSKDDLEQQVDRAWRWMQGLSPTPDPGTG